MSEGRTEWVPVARAASPGDDASEETRSVWERLDGSRSVAEVGRLCGLSTERVLVVLGHLVRRGLVEPMRRPGENREHREADLRKVYAEEIQGLDVDARVALVAAAEGALLAAFCLDPHPRVVAALLENELTGLSHARLIARHHRSATGLEILLRSVSYARDAEVRRRLLRNPQLNDGLFQRLVGDRPLLELHKLIVSRDVTERSRSAARKTLRTRFQSADAEQKVALIFKTEGRCLSSLAGVPLDGRTTALLCGRNYQSQLLVQNLARWPSTPPPVLAHLARQGMVKRQPRLRQMLLQHPNAPAQLKRDLGE